jgi:hypothetical protein
MRLDVRIPVSWDMTLPHVCLKRRKPLAQRRSVTEDRTDRLYRCENLKISLVVKCYIRVLEVISYACLPVVHNLQMFHAPLHVASGGHRNANSRYVHAI